MSELNSLLPVLQCPLCKEEKLDFNLNLKRLVCATCAAEYPVVHDIPVLLRADNAVFCIEDYQRILTPSYGVTTKIGVACFIPSPSINLASNRLLTRLKNLLAESATAKVLIVGGGRQRQWLDVALGVSETISIVYSDIDVSADVDVFCDGHDLPFVDGCFDAVVTTAVLEHVMYPERVATEISRVLKIDGLLYSELPFMQQVHEGAYDFTRYTLSGHRRLFNRFAEIESGLVAGPATALVWAIENLILAFLSRPALRKLAKATVRISFFWLKYLDYFLVNRPEAMDGASCTYFLGRKIMATVPDTKIISDYIGAKHLSHT